MAKKVLIISPYFPPSNTADIHRIRTSLPYFEEFGWEVTVVTVDERYSDSAKDILLSQCLPAGIKIYKIKAFDKKITSKLGLGSLALRSLFYYLRTVNALLRREKFDLIYFSTTEFMVTILGAYWKKRFNIPYVIDMQDPWYSTHYEGKAKEQRPPKYRLAYTLHKFLEPIAMRDVQGLISVSAKYIHELKIRYPSISNVPSAVITFGAFAPDQKIAYTHRDQFNNLLNSGHINVVYIGRGGEDMHKALTPVFEALRQGLEANADLFNRLRFYFIGTSYAPAGTGIPTILPLAKKYGVERLVVEITDRIGYFHTLCTLQEADALLICGSEDPAYTASKIYPYLLSQKPLIALFHVESNSVVAFKECATNVLLLTFGQEISNLAEPLYKQFTEWVNDRFKPVVLLPEFDNYSAKTLTGKQIELFNQALSYFEKTDTDH